MELHHLRHFVAVAEELHFGRAAQRLGIAQPPLSQSIKRFEESLGGLLFDRSRGRVALTPIGALLLPHARDILSKVELAERLTRRAVEGRVDRIRIGSLPWSLTRTLPRSLRRFKQRWAGVDLRLYEQVSLKQVALLRHGELDLATVALTNADISGLAHRVVERNRLVAAIPSSWALARQRSVRLADLAHAPFVTFTPHLSPGSYERLINACRAAGFEPNIVQESAQPYSLLNMVANELGVSLIHNTTAQMRVEGVSLVEISDSPPNFETEIALVWQAEAMTPPLQYLIDCIVEEAQADDDSPRRG